MTQREIKFRVFDREAKQIVDISEMQVGITTTAWVIYNDKNRMLVDGETADFMQYTGLHDSKGVEIYESDIVYLAGYGNYEVEFPFIELYEACQEKDIGEIIGNIYENEALLTNLDKEKK